MADRVTLTSEALEECRTLLAQEGLDGTRAPLIRIGIGSCGLRRPVAAPGKPEPGDTLLEVEGIPFAIASTLAGNFRVGVGRGRFGAWLELQEE